MAYLLVSIGGALTGWGLACFGYWTFETHQKKMAEIAEKAKAAPPPSIQTKAEEVAKRSPSPKTEPPSPVKAPPKQSPPIQIAPFFGDLKARCISLSQGISELVRHRYDQLENKYPKPLTAERRQEWHRSNDVEFRHEYLAQVKAIRDEFAVLHYVDNDLDQILERDQRNAQFRTVFPVQGVPQELGWIDIYDIQKVAERLLVLASKLP